METLKPTRDYAAVNEREKLGPAGPVRVALQCGCGWTVTITVAKDLGQCDAFDWAERLYSDHLLEEGPTCRPWMS